MRTVEVLATRDRCDKENAERIVRRMDADEARVAQKKAAVAVKAVNKL